VTIADIRFRPRGMRTNSGIICLEGDHETEASAEAARKIAHELIPWRKGPFCLGGLSIDAEWRSDLKWNRLRPASIDFRNKVVADVGCNNGYYLFQIASQGAREVVGFDPTIKYKMQYDLVAAHAPELPIEFRLEGWQALREHESRFDIIFLMGINYHDPDPYEIYHACRSALKPGGLMICESIIARGASELTIYPPGKYFGIGGVYGVPTTASLMQDLLACGFHNVYVQNMAEMTSIEQRASEFSPQKSLADFQRADGWSNDANGMSYPPLWRAAIFARRNNA